MKKFIRIFLLAFIIFVSIAVNLNVEAATTAPTTINMGYGEQLDSYVGGTYFTIKVTTDGKYAYCFDKEKDTPFNMSMKLVEGKDAGVTYIIKNGYPNKSFTGNKKYDYYITQTALWWYLDDTTGTSTLGDYFKSSGPDSHGLRKHIISLKEAAKKAKNTGYTKPSVSLTSANTSFTLSSDGKYYYSGDITVKGTSTTGNITLSLTNAPSNAIIVDANGNKKTTVASGAKVKIRVPASSISKLSADITINARATGKTDKAYLYEPTDSRYQRVVVGVLYSETKTVETSKKYTLKATHVEITKIDAETNKPLAGAKLQLKNSSGKVVATWTTTTRSHIIRNLPAGTYKLVETSAPSGYNLNPEEKSVTLVAGKTTTVSFYNSKKEPTKVIIVKRDKSTGKTVAGAKFILKNSKGEEVASWTSTTKGHSITGLPEGKYTLKETAAPTGYKKSDEVHTVTLKSGKTVTVNFYNEKQPTNVVIIKRDKQTGKTVAGAKFVLKNSKGEKVANWTSTEEGYSITGLPEGKYTLTETEAPKGYEKSKEVYTVTLEAGKTVTVDFYNEKQPTNVVIIKRDKQTGKTVAGAKFVLKNSKGEKVANWTSTEEGHSITGLPEGEYTLIETEAPKGYIKSEEIYTIKLEAGKTVTVNFYNEEEPVITIVKIIKVNGETGERIAGAELVLKDANGNVVKTWTTTEEEYIIEGLAPGKYYLSETKAPSGFVLSTEIIEIVVTEEAEIQTITFYNTPEVEVPNTLTSTSILTIVIGMVTMVVGGSIVFISLRREAK